MGPTWTLLQRRTIHGKDWNLSSYPSPCLIWFIELFKAIVQLPPTSNCQDGASHMIPNGTSSWFLSWTFQRKTWPFWGKKPYHLGAGDQGNRRLTVHDATERWDFETGAMDGQWSMMLIGFFSAQNAGILNRVSIPFKLTFKANKLGVQMAMVRPGPTLQLGRRRLDVWDRWLDHQPRKRKRPWPAWAMKYQEWTSWSTSRRCRCGTGDGVIPLAIKRWCQLMFHDGLWWFMHVYAYLDMLPLFFDKGMARKSPSISYRSQS